MTDVRPGGKRRIDRVLAPDYLDRLALLPVGTVRVRLVEAEGEEAELSYLRRRLHDRIELVTAEQQRRAALADPTGLGPGPASRTAATGQRRARVLFGRPVTESGRPDRRRRRVERLVTDVDLSDVNLRTDDELDRVLRTYRTEEKHVTDVRAQVRRVVDQCSEELASRLVAGALNAAPDSLLGNGFAIPDLALPVDGVRAHDPAPDASGSASPHANRAVTTTAADEPIPRASGADSPSPHTDRALPRAAADERIPRASGADGPDGEPATGDSW